MTPLQQFQTLLADLFQLDYADLDFGIYRLFKLKEREVRAFIEEDLPRAVDAAFGAAEAGDQAAARADLEALRAEIVGTVGDAAVNADGTLAETFAATPFVKDRAVRYDALRASLAAGTAAEGSRADAFNHLLAFFGRYYEAGDFLPRRRYGRTETYAAPYDGQEVLFHWPTRGMHYIKSGEHFRDYAFTVDGAETLRVRFALTDADLPRDNVKGDTRFFFALPDAATFEAGTDGAPGTLTVPFHYRTATAAEGKPKQDDLLDAAHDGILTAAAAHAPFAAEALRAPQNEAGATLLAKRLRHFARRNTTDYFLFPDLGPFLRRELDFYLKDQVLHLDDLDGDFDARRRLIRVIREVGERIVTFLDQIESVQVRLFEKPKLVLRTDYLVPVQHVPEALWADVLANAEQRAAWARLFATPADTDAGAAVDADFLRSHPTLVVDTAHFADAFRWRLLAALPFDSLDEATDGVLVHAENYQALTALRPRFAGEVQTVYIDPPYNTGGDGFIYKDRYQHASWLTMMEERILLGRTLMSQNGLLFASINDVEQDRLSQCLRIVFDQKNYIDTYIWNSTFRPDNSSSIYRRNAEFVHCYANNKSSISSLVGEKIERTGLPSLTKSSMEESELLFPSGSVEFSIPDGLYLAGDKGSYTLIDDVSVKNGTNLSHFRLRGRVTWGQNNLIAELSMGTIIRIKTDGFVPYVDKGEEGTLRPAKIIPNNIVGDVLGASKNIRHMFGQDVFDYPKPVSLIGYLIKFREDQGPVIDFFAGSGTTGHAVIDLNREDGGRRRFILAEQGDYTDTVLLPRIQKAMYAPSWKDGRPAEEPTVAGILGGETVPDWIARSPRLVRVVRLESYDDAVHNLAATAAPGADGAETPVTRRAAAVERIVGEDTYRLRYLFRLPLDAAATALNTGALTRPFALTLETLTEAGPVARPVDLAETAAMLLGLRVDRVREHTEDGRRHLVLHAHDKAGAPVVVALRDLVDAAGAPVDAAADRAALEAVLADLAPGTRVLVNADSAYPAAESLDVALAAALAPSA